jgi:hypothetical protein
MVQYTLAQSPEIILNVPGKDSAKAREKAMDQLMELMDSGKLPTELEEGFGSQQLIEVKETGVESASDEDGITQAVQILSNLATLKLKVQESRSEALEIRKALDILFSDQSVSEEEISRLKEGFKVLKNFAQANLRYQHVKYLIKHSNLLINNGNWGISDFPINQLNQQKKVASYDYLLITEALGFEPRNVGTKTRCLTTWRRLITLTLSNIAAKPRFLSSFF